MQVNPEYERFGEIHDMTPEVEKLMEEMAVEGKIIAKSYSKEQLQKLQEDLLRSGYKSIFAK